jgi:hypothetical protein
LCRDIIPNAGGRLGLVAADACSCHLQIQALIVCFASRRCSIFDLACTSRQRRLGYCGQTAHCSFRTSCCEIRLPRVLSRPPATIPSGGPPMR